MKPSELFDPDLPTASAVMASLCCVATQYVSRPSIDLAHLASTLAYKLTAPEYAESQLITEVAKRLVYQWDQVVREHQHEMANQEKANLISVSYSSQVKH